MPSKPLISEPKYLLYDFEFRRTVFTDLCFLPFFEFAWKEFNMDFMVYYLIVKKFVALPKQHEELSNKNDSDQELASTLARIKSIENFY